ncbi:uncharacterized protein LOC132784015 [Drosophila nasuta]|uniref:uncharacterized protein LOC132784015 n=1 Tax=Drosophila nasuta TaxID=42062 RepID=UPI00295E6DFF|nr:uncharacterized protein LOC132784015 [Drosophila nasuta]
MYLFQALILLIIFFSFTYTYTYIPIAEDEDIFHACAHQTGKVYNFDTLFDLSETNFRMDGESVIFNGNFTTIWDVKPTDRIQVDVRILHFDKGAWLPTLYSILVYDFCPLMFNDKQYWYTIFIGNLINLEEVRNKCLNSPGTVYRSGNCNLTATFDTFEKLSGLYKLEIKLTAYNKLGIPRPTVICTELKGELRRIN